MSADCYAQAVWLLARAEAELGSGGSPHQTVSLSHPPSGCAEVWPESSRDPNSEGIEIDGAGDFMSSGPAPGRLWRSACLVAIRSSRTISLRTAIFSHYVKTATEIEYPDVKTQSLDEVEGAEAPFTLENNKPREMWDLKLEDVVKIAMANSKVIRSVVQGGGSAFQSTPQGQPTVGGAPSTLQLGLGSGARGGVQTGTVYDNAIIEAAPFGANEGFGVEAALSQFDAQFTSNLIWEKNDRPQNVQATGPFGDFFTPIFEQDNGTFNAQIAKTTATGGQLPCAITSFMTKTIIPPGRSPAIGT